MTLTTSLSTRPSSSTRTTSFDLRSTVTEGDGTAGGVNAAFAVAWTMTAKWRNWAVGAAHSGGRRLGFRNPARAR